MVSPTRRRDAVNYLTRRHRVSERRACKVIGQHRSTQRYQRIAPDFEQKLVKRMNQLADRISPLRLSPDLGFAQDRGFRGQQEKD